MSLKIRQLPVIVLLALCFPAFAQILPWASEEGDPSPVNEAHIFADGEMMAFPADDRLDLPGGEGVIEFWFKRAWEDDVAGKKEYFAVIANGRAMGAKDDDAGGIVYRTRYALYLNEKVLALQVGDKLQTVSLSGSSGQDIVAADGFVHVALIFENGQVQPVINGSNAQRLADMPLGELFGSEVTVGSIGGGRGDFPADGKRMKPVEKEVHDFAGEIARLRVWSSAYSDRYFQRGENSLARISDERLHRGVAFPSLGAEYERPNMSDLVARSDFRGDSALHRLVTVSPVAGTWVAESFRDPIPAPDETPLVERMGDMALPPLITLVADNHLEAVEVFLDGRYIGLLRFKDTLAEGEFHPAGGTAGEFAKAHVRLLEDGQDVLAFDFEGVKGLSAFVQPGASALRSLRLVRPDPYSWRGDAVEDAGNEYIASLLQTYTNTNARSYNVATMDPLNLTTGDTGTTGNLFKPPGNSDWLRDTESSGVTAPRWFRVVPINRGASSSNSTTVTNAREFRTAISARLGATVGMPGRSGVAIDASLQDSSSRIDGKTRATTLGMSYGAHHALVLDHPQAPLSEDFIRSVARLRMDALRQHEDTLVVVGAGGSATGNGTAGAKSSGKDDDADWFIQQWGTHYAAAVTYGQLMLSVTELSEDKFREAEKTGFDISFETRVSGSAEGGGTEAWGPRGGFGRESERVWEELESSKDTRILSWPPASLSADPAMATLSPDNTVPIFLDLRPLHELLSPIHFDDPAIYLDTREYLRKKIMRYLASHDEPSSEWGVVPDINAEPVGATMFLEPVSLEASYIDELDTDGEFYGRLSVTPIIQGVTSTDLCGSAGPDNNGEPQPATCDAEYRGPENGQSERASPPALWWETSEDTPEVLKNFRETPWTNLKNRKAENSTFAYHFDYPVLGSSARSTDDQQRMPLDDVQLKFEWWVKEDDPDSGFDADDQLWGYWVGNNVQDGRIGSNFPFPQGSESASMGFARWIVEAEELRFAWDDFDYGTLDETWAENPPRATDAPGNRRKLRFVMRDAGDTVDPSTVFTRGVAFAIGEDSETPQGVTLTVEGWLQEHDSAAALLAKKLGGINCSLDKQADPFATNICKLANYNRRVTELAPKPSARPPKRRRPFNHPNLVGFFPLDEDGRDLSGKALPLANPIPEARVFDGGVLYADPHLGRQGVFAELPHFDPAFVVPGITEGSFTVRLSFRPRSPHTVGLEGESLARLPLLIRGEGEFVVTNEAFASREYSSYSEIFMGGPNFANIFSGEPLPRSPVWATLTVAVDMESRQIRHHLDYTLPEFMIGQMAVTAAKAQTATALLRMGRGFNPGTSSEWYLSGTGSDGVSRYAVDTIDEVMFFDKALSFDEIAALPKRSIPDARAKRKAVGIHVANMYRHAVRMLELDGNNPYSRARFEALDLSSYKPKFGFVVDETFYWIRDADPEKGPVNMSWWQWVDDFEKRTRDAHKQQLGIEERFMSRRTCDEACSLPPGNSLERINTCARQCATDFDEQYGDALSRLLGEPAYYWTESSLPIKDNGNGEYDYDEFLQEFASDARKQIFFRINEALAGDNQKAEDPQFAAFSQMADMTINHDIEQAVLAADLDENQRIDADEAALLSNTLVQHFESLAKDRVSPAPPQLENAPVFVFGRIVDDNAQGRVAKWLELQLKELGMNNSIPIEVRRF